MTSACAVLLAVASWQTPEVNSLNRLPARDELIPCQSEKLAVDIKGLNVDREKSDWVMSLNGEWDFRWKRTPEASWEKDSKIVVPGCWQLQGDYDPPLYTNVKYPIAYNLAGDPLAEPPTNYTSYVCRNPVGRYTRTFRRPWRWYFRRTVLRFNGVSSAFELKVNGQFVGYSEDSRLPAEFDISPFLKWWGDNTVEVTVYKHCDGTYLEDQDFWRLSGIFRDVYLVSEHPDAPKDLSVEAWLSDDYKQGKFTVRDEKGNALKVRDVPEPKLWCPETPYLYVTPIEFTHGWWLWKKTEYYAATIGFRRVEVRDAVIYLNGKRILFKGVNRHEMSPTGGYAVTLDEMSKDVRVLKSMNVNAVRTCHYPDDPRWYALCDIEGLMLVAEANIEGHGAPGSNSQKNELANAPAWERTFVERGERMVKMYRNHPSIVVWSVGNETGVGPNTRAEFKAMRAADPTARPIMCEGVHYERTRNDKGFQFLDVTDTASPMYMPAAAIESSYLTKNPDKPFFLCEYVHAMGNSTGSLGDYWALARKYPSFQGGFVWDFADQAVYKRGADGEFLAYGGDFGDKPNDDNFNCNGIVDALRNFHPGAWELKHAYRPIRVTSFDFATRELTIANDYAFEPREKVHGTWKSLDAEGAPVASGKLDISSLMPGATGSFKIGGEPGDSIVFRFVSDDGDEVAWDGFARPFVPKAVPTGTPCENPGFRLNFWRAPTDNDRGWGMPAQCAVWKKATDTQQLPKGVTSELKCFSVAPGKTLVDWTLVVPKGLPPIPRVGLTFTVPYDSPNVTWFGLGPWENYADRCESATLGVHKGFVTLSSGLRDPKTGVIPYRSTRLNPDNYIEPGEQGYRTGCRRLEVCRCRVTALNAPFGFNVWPYPQTELEGKKHITEMKTADGVYTVNIDAAQLGVGGDDSWSPRARAHAPFCPGEGTYRLQFLVEDI